jgi:cobalamin biosynthesis protein CbiG
VTPDLVVGLGCRPGTAADRVRELLDRLLAEHGLTAADVRAYATVDARAGEPGLRAIAGDGLLAFPADVLATVAVPNPSDVVAAALGSPSVAEAAALHAATLLGGHRARLVGPKLTGPGVTAAVARIVTG